MDVGFRTYRVRKRKFRRVSGRRHSGGDWWVDFPVWEGVVRDSGGVVDGDKTGVS